MSAIISIHHFPVIVLGSGISGMCAALKAGLKKGQECETATALISQGDESLTNTYLAQGGIAAALKDIDSPYQHYKDTLQASSGLTNPDIVHMLAEGGPETIDQLEQLGVEFDKDQRGDYKLAKEGAHSYRRILRCGGDRSGQQIAVKLADKIINCPYIARFNCHKLLKLLVIQGTCMGAITLDDEGEFHLFFSDSTILATGGYGGLFEKTSNQPGALGDAIGEALLQGATVADLEFVQFHPTGLEIKDIPSQGKETNHYPASNYYYPAFTNQYPLISEAVRGEKALLINDTGRRIMDGVHPLEELAPRDVVSATIYQYQQAGSRVYLDATHLNTGYVEQRFPGISSMLKKYGLDLARDRIPVTPAAHYTIGGILTPFGISTGIKGLFAAGEATSSGVHGANRLASNSLLEGAFFGFMAGKRALELHLHYKEKSRSNSSERTLFNNHEKNKFIKQIQKNFSQAVEHLTDNDKDVFFHDSDFNQKFIAQIQNIMWTKAGVIRDESKLQEGLIQLKTLEQEYFKSLPKNLQKLQQHNLQLSPLPKVILLAKKIIEASLRRRENRGVHKRREYLQIPEQNPDKFLFRQAYNISKGWFKYDNGSYRLVR
ncbi:L-aspartate oxidase [Natranaerobius thermophilus]|uniref:L-aspartate oxidase n=1 Tax=Natranaerobius thermophilus (strain ATCC BAA-1301 / DSM 18059 / JW/NM-WN-LF) TaxID=457570 RepID=B2A0U9_NATTJ|nr:FAD-binding protein [Natranaerobius thermophilus]ACB85979.1 L-aspartate oxidase [Natranaerobius thermophilus JW/NM-WN-LF]